MHLPFSRLLAVVLLAVSLAPCLTFAQGQGLLALRGARIETVTKDGAIDDAVLLIRDGKIEALGKDVKLPVTARVIDASGMTIMPGIVDPYFVVTIGRNAAAAEQRIVVFQGRVFVVGGGSIPIATTFVKISDGINLEDIDWDPARRSGITTMHVATGGFAQSLIAKSTKESATISDPDGKLLTTVSNDSQSLAVLRSGLGKQPRQRPSSSGSESSSEESPSGPSSGSGTSTAPSSSSGNLPTQLWEAVREGKSHVFVNVNNPAAILHTLSVAEDSKKAKIAFVAEGDYVYRTLDDLDPKTHTIIMAPAIDTIPNSQNRINVPKMLAEKKINFAFSPSLGQSNFRSQQDSPLFAVGMLVRTGLDRETALRSLTITPAELLGIDKEVGTLEVGKQADFIVLSGDPFAATTGIKEIFIDGKSIYEN